MGVSMSCHWIRNHTYSDVHRIDEWNVYVCQSFASLLVIVWCLLLLSRFRFFFSLFILLSFFVWLCSLCMVTVVWLWYSIRNLTNIGEVVADWDYFHFVYRLPSHWKMVLDWSRYRFEEIESRLLTQHKMCAKQPRITKKRTNVISKSTLGLNGCLHG